LAREMCHRCNRPVALCYCHALVDVDNRIPLVIIQQRQEAFHPYNSARILKLCLHQCYTIQSEQFTLEDIEALLPQHQLILLFPEDGQENENEEDKEECSTSASNSAEKVALIVIDATWKKAKKIYFSNPWMQQLPKLSLGSQHQSNYRIRKASKDNYLSTLESSVLGLVALGESSQVRELYKTFDALVEQQLAAAKRTELGD